MYLPISQLVPSYPGGQVQLNEFIKSSQEPPFLQGSVSQSFMSASRKSTSCSLEHKGTICLLLIMFVTLLVLRLVGLSSFSVFSFLEITFSHLIINIQLDTYKTGFLENIAQLHKLIFDMLHFFIQ